MTRVVRLAALLLAFLGFAAPPPPPRVPEPPRAGAGAAPAQREHVAAPREAWGQAGVLVAAGVSRQPEQAPARVESTRPPPWLVNRALLR